MQQVRDHYLDIVLGCEIIFTGFLKNSKTACSLASSVGCILRDAQIYMELLSLSERQERERVQVCQVDQT